MISEELKEVVDSIKEKGKMAFLPGISEEEILEFEKSSKITLPSKYKEWLQFSDGGELYLPAGVQLYGVEHKPVIDINDDSRPSDEFVVIGAFATGDPILFKKGEETISIYNQELGEIDDELVFENFEELLKELYDLLGLGE